MKISEMFLMCLISVSLGFDGLILSFYEMIWVLKSNVFFVLDPPFALTCSPWRSPCYHLIYFLFETLLVITVFAKLNSRELKVTGKSPFAKSRNSSLANFYSFQLLFFFKVLCLLVCVVYYSMTHSVYHLTLLHSLKMQVPYRHMFILQDFCFLCKQNRVENMLYPI